MTNLDSIFKSRDITLPTNVRLVKAMVFPVVTQSPGREAALAWASLAQRFPASSVLAREGAGCGPQTPATTILLSCYEFIGYCLSF